MEPASPIQESLPQTPVTQHRLLPWGPVAAVVVTIFAYFGSQVLGGVLISIYPLIKRWNSQQGADWLAHSVYAQFFFVVIVEAITLWLIWLFLKRRHARAAQIGLKKVRPIDVVYALSGFAIYFLTYIFIAGVIQKFAPHVNTSQKQDLGFSTNSTGLALGAIFISLVLLPPIVEEIVVRGFLYTGLRSKLPKIIAAVITSILFAAAHLQLGSGNAPLWIAAIDTFILSLVLVYLRDTTDSLWPSIMLHMMKNGIAFVSLFILHLS